MPREEFDSRFRPERIVLCEEGFEIAGLYEFERIDDYLHICDMRFRSGLESLGRNFFEYITNGAKAEGIKKIVIKVSKKDNPACCRALAFGFVQVKYDENYDSFEMPLLGESTKQFA